MNLPVREFSASGYRSLQKIAYPMSRLDVFVGANGVGKSNLYRGLELLRAAAANTLGRDLAREGLDLAMWAGPKTYKQPAVRLTVSLEAPGPAGSFYRYEIEAGFPPKDASATFEFEPQVKSEILTHVSGTRSVRFLDRSGPSVMVRDDAGRPAVFATLAYIRQDTVDLDAAVAAAFPGARLIVDAGGRMASFGVAFPEFPTRVFEAGELSDGTLRFLSLAGALMAYRLPPFIALNEPESSLHPDLMAPLAQMVVRAAARTQVWLVTHSERLAEAIGRSGAGAVRIVTKHKGATTIEGLTLLGTFRDDD